MQNTKQIILSASLIAAFILFVIYEKTGNSTIDPTRSPMANTAETTVANTSSVSLASDEKTQAIDIPIVSPPTHTNPKSTIALTPTVAPTPSPVIKSNPVPAPAPISQASGFKNGTFNGKVADAYYGNMQVAAIISGGRLSDVKFLQFPNEQHESLEISNRSLPKLKTEAISSQSAKVDIISGATQTSEAFNETLADALFQAKA